MISTWYALTDEEADILRESRIQNSKAALRTLKAYKADSLEQKPKQLVKRDYHLAANAHRMTHLDELRFCVKRILQIITIQTTHRLGLSKVYNRIFLKEERQNLN